MNKQNEYLYPVNFFYKQNRPWQKKICRGGNLLAILSDYTNYFIIFTLDFCPFFFKSLLYAFSFLAGTLIFAFAWIPLNALLPTFFRETDLIVILLRFLAFSNARLRLPEHSYQLQLS